MKLINVAMAVGLILTITMSLAGFGRESSTIRENILRLHVLANSNSEEDQALKLRVRDSLLQTGMFNYAMTRDEAYDLAVDSKDIIKNIAAEEIEEGGHEYDVQVSVIEAFFPTVEYDMLTLPAGRYKTVRVEIGAAYGDNWWCVMFPSMCLPAAAERGFSDVLNERQMDIVNNAHRYEFRFRSVEIFESLRERFRR